MSKSQKFNIIITGTVQIKEEHLELLKENGINAERIPFNPPTEEQLIKAVPGKDGYILGSIEGVTQAVIDAGSSLRAICFTGAGWVDFIPAHEYATKRGIAITSAAGANAQAVAELTVGFIHDRVRNIAYLSGQGSGQRLQGRNFRALTLGIVGAGNIGSKVARILNHAYGTRVLYANPHRKLDLEFSTGAERVPFETLLRESDIVSLHAKRTPETLKLINQENIGLMKDGAILINASFAEAIDPYALYDEVSKERISAALDVHYPKGMELPDFSKVSSRYLIQMGIQSGYNTAETVMIASGLATRSMINLLTTGKDEAVVNPTFIDYGSLCQTK
jgi:D-3-phosphoglycerate dehydrogenase